MALVAGDGTPIVAVVFTIQDAHLCDQRPHRSDRRPDHTLLLQDLAHHRRHQPKQYNAKTGFGKELRVGGHDYRDFF